MSAAPEGLPVSGERLPAVFRPLPVRPGRLPQQFPYVPGDDRVATVRTKAVPAGMPPLGVPAVELVGRTVPLDELPATATRRLARELRDLAPEQVVPRLARTLPDRLSAVTDRSRTSTTRRGHRLLRPVTT
jgi:hypothetical protein